jgi:glutamate synthase (NADPH/NADH) small chain
LNIDNAPVGIKSIEHAIIDKAWEQGWVVPQLAAEKTGKRVAVIGSGPAGLACAQQLARVGHEVTVFEKNDRVGGLMRYGIPDFKMEKALIDRRIGQMEAEGVKFRTGIFVGKAFPTNGIANYAKQIMAPETLLGEFESVVLAAGSEVPRDLPAKGRDLDGVHFALEFLIPQNKEVAGDGKNAISAKGKHVIVIGGGDTGSDCVGTSNRHGAASITQIELMPKPPLKENGALTWPYWPNKLRTSSSQEEGCERDWSVTTKEFIAGTGADAGHIKAIKLARVEWKDGRMTEIPGSEFEVKADLVLLAMGFTNPLASMLDAFGVEKDARGNARADVDGSDAYATSVSKVFAAGDVRRGQSLIVWAIREGRQCARAVDEFLMGSSVLPR